MLGQKGYVFDCNGSAVVQAVDKDNAELIVHVANNYDRLLLALKSCDFIMDFLMETVECSPELEERFKKAHANAQSIIKECEAL